ncbi:MAG: AEC family transporter [Chlamydiota bacterium]
MEIFELILPIFGILATGTLAKNFKLVKPELSFFLIQFIFYIGAPALLIRVIATTPIEMIWRSDFFFVVGLIFPLFILLTFINKFLLKRPFLDSNLYALSATMSNAGFIGLPILYTTFGEPSILPATFSILIMILLLTLSIFVLEISASAHSSIRSACLKALLNSIKNPIIISCVIGIFYSLFNLPKPAGLFKYLKLLEGSVTPCALFAVGMQIEYKSFFKGLKATFFSSLFKLIILPALVLLLTLKIKLPPIWAISAVFVNALPTAKSCFIISNIYDKSLNQHIVKRVSMILAVTTFLSIFTLFAWLILLSMIFSPTSTT